MEQIRLHMGEKILNISNFLLTGLMRLHDHYLAWTLDGSRSRKRHKQLQLLRLWNYEVLKALEAPWESVQPSNLGGGTSQT